MKDIVVTGAYGGMGRATVSALKNRGFRVFALDRKVGEAEENIVPVEVDVRDRESVSRAAETVKSMSDGLFAVLHFAGVYMLDSLVEIPTEDFEKIFEINVFGAFYVNRALMPLLKKGSRIILTTSELAPLDPLPFTGLYAVTKAALDKYAYSLRMELQLLGVSVSVLRAGAVSTEMLGVSTSALDAFCAKTELYSCNAERFRRIVDSVEAKSVPPEKVAAKMLSVLQKRKPSFAYSLNGTPLLKLLNLLPKRLQLFAIRQVLKTR